MELITASVIPLTRCIWLLTKALFCSILRGMSNIISLCSTASGKNITKRLLCVFQLIFIKTGTGGLKYYRSKGIKTYTTKKTDSLANIHHDNRARFLLNGDTTFNVGDYTFQIYYAGPGHTIDNVEVLFPREKILYGGCFIKSVEDKNLGNLDDADVKEWGNSIKNLQEKFPDPEYVI